MIRQFTMTTLLRRTPFKALRWFLPSVGLDMGFDWDKMRACDLPKVLAAYEQIPDANKEKAEITVQEIIQLADIDGVAALKEAAKICGVSYWELAFKVHSSAYLQAIYAWSEHRNVFEKAKELLRTNRAVATRKRIGLPVGVAPFSEEKIQRLQFQLQNFLQEKDKCGKVCTVDVIERDMGKFCIIAYPDGHAVPKLYHDDEAKLRPRMDVSVFEILFGIDTVAGTLELSTHLPKRLKQDLEDLFIRTLYEIEPPPVMLPTYNLQMLKDPKLVLATEAKDNLKAEVCFLSIKWPGIKAASTFTAYQDGTFVKSIAYLLGHTPHDLKDGTVLHAKIRFHFHPQPGRRAGTLCIDFTSENNMVIGCKDSLRVGIMERYLKEWRIA